MNFIRACMEGQELYQVTLGNEGPVLFRLLPYSVFLKLQGLILGHPKTVPFVEDEVWTQCVIEHPYLDALDDMLAGTVSTVANLILFLSGLPDFPDKESLLDYSRYLANTDLMLQMQTLLCRTFPAYTPEMLEGLTLTELFKRVAQAEFATQQEFKLIDPDKEVVEKKPPGSIDFDAENIALQETGWTAQDPHDQYGLRK